MSGTVPNETAVKTIFSTLPQKHSDFQQEQSRSIVQIVIYPSTRLNIQYEQTDIKDAALSMTQSQQQNIDTLPNSLYTRHSDHSQPKEVESRANQSIPQSINTQIQPGPTKQKLARLTKQQRQLLSRGKDIIGYIYSNEKELYESFSKKDLKQMDQELRSLYMLRLYGGPFDYTAINFIDGHMYHIESIVNKAEQIVPRLKNWIFKTINFFVPDSYERHPMGKEGKYQYNSHKEDEESKNIKDQ